MFINKNIDDCLNIFMNVRLKFIPCIHNNSNQVSWQSNEFKKLINTKKEYGILQFVKDFGHQIIVRCWVGVGFSI